MEEKKENKIQRYQQIIKEIEMHSNILEQVKQKLNLITQEIESVTSVDENLRYRLMAIERLETGKGMIRVTEGVFAQGDVKVVKNLLLNIGHNIFIIKDKDYVKEFIQKQIRKIEDILNKKRKDYDNNLKNFVIINNKLSKLMQEYKAINNEIKKT